MCPFYKRGGHGEKVGGASEKETYQFSTGVGSLHFKGLACVSNTVDYRYVNIYPTIL